ncbi:unnamed protein product [Miscanthus lutarioriparius]|uniref:Methyltransferase-like protein 17, mitochondrial n=1 Tax=Miscanthus lutarioriparius TaxID=422564 RepID=A0A811MFW6_9POAL|nr:unnamed protein product [Miscanthus lutarioriparius]
MAAALLPETAPRLLTPETLRTAAKQSQGIHLVPLSLRRAIKRYLRDQDKAHMNRKVLLLSASFDRAKGTGAELAAAATRSALLDDPNAPSGAEQRAARWKVRSAYGDIGLRYREDETVAYVASRMPAIYAACHRVLREVRRRLPEFAPAKVLDFGAGPSSALWAMRAVWPKSIERVNLVEPSKEMQRAGQSLLDNLKGLPLIHSYDSIQELNRKIEKHERGHDLVVSVLLEPGTPQGAKIISQMRSYILWMEKRDPEGVLKCALTFLGTASEYLFELSRSKGVPLRGFEDEKFCYVALRRGKRPEEAWPLDGLNFEKLKERHAKRKPEDLIIDYDDQFPSEEDEEVPVDGGDSLVPYASDEHELSLFHESEEAEEDQTIRADLGGGWGRIIYSPIRRGRQVQMDVCRSTKRDASEGAFERVVVTRSKNPTLHFQARRSLWGDLWPF